MTVPDVSNKIVAVFDIGFSKEITVNMINQANRFILLDHHKSQMMELQNLRPFTFFDMNRSGATLAWNFFHPTQPIPSFINYIEEKGFGLV